LSATPSAAASHGQPSPGQALRSNTASNASFVPSQIHGPTWIAQAWPLTGGLYNTSSSAKATNTTGHQRTRAVKSWRSEPLKQSAAITATNVGANSPNMTGGFTPSRRQRRRQQP